MIASPALSIVADAAHAVILDQARSLPEVGFAVQKEQLAEQLTAPYDVRPHGDNTTTKVARHLLCPEIIPLLGDRLNDMQW